MSGYDRPTTADYAADGANIANLQRRVEMLETAMTSVLQDLAVAAVSRALPSGLEVALGKYLWELDGYTHWEQSGQERWAHQRKARQILVFVASFSANKTSETTDEPS